MKTKPIKTIAFSMMAAIMIAIMFVTSCKKEEGPVGPAGAAGAAGPTGIAGTTGTNGTDATLVSAADQASYDAASGTIGARLYDHCLNETNNADATMSDAAYSNFFRCKSCHGWDLRGTAGVLINKAPSATYPNASRIDLFSYAKQHNIRQIFDAVKNVGGRKRVVNNGRNASPANRSYNGIMPDYSSILTDAQVWQLVKFLKNDAHNTDDFYEMTTTGTYPTGGRTFSNIGKGGDPVAGKVTYDAKCKSCHGATGTNINVYCKGIYLGDMFRDDPHEIQHKAIWGMPMDREYAAAGCADAGVMPVISVTDQDIRNMMVMGQDTVAFPGF